jgi:predicted DNA-binding ArsR family transcriptional regulator
MATQQDRTMRALNILAKWRVLFTGWQLGTRAKGDPEGDAVRDHREVTIMLRAELSALNGLLLEKGVYTGEEWLAALEQEAGLLAKDYERKFPGVTAHEDGLTFDKRALAWMKGWRP